MTASTARERQVELVRAPGRGLRVPNCHPNCLPNCLPHQVELVRQVEIFESEMIEDTDEIAQLPNLGTHLDQSGQAELVERTAAAHLSAVVGSALEAAVGSPLQLLQVRSPLIALDCIDCPRGGR